jgi:hypothetical protein
MINILSIGQYPIKNENAIKKDLCRSSNCPLDQRPTPIGFNRSKKTKRQDAIHA